MSSSETTAAVPAMREAAARVVEFFETLSPASLDQLGALYTPQAYFKDPFNEVSTLADIRQIFSHMYEALAQPHFVVTGKTVRGGSHLKFNAQGRVEFHRDYWDAAEELYEKLPVVGGLMRWLKQRARQ